MYSGILTAFNKNKETTDLTFTVNIIYKYNETQIINAWSKDGLSY